MRCIKFTEDIDIDMPQCRRYAHVQGTDAELQVHLDESTSHHLEMGVEHTAQV